MDSPQAPLYVRWNAERLPFAIEIRLDVIGRLARDIRLLDSTGIEVGGVLIGSHPTALNPTFRIEDYQLVPRRPEDGPIFMLDPREHDRFATARWERRQDGRTTVGFFRSHRRTGPLRPSLADRTLLTREFAGETYAALLVDASEPLTTALFVGTQGELPDQPSVPEFRLDERSFSSLPEIPIAGPPPAVPTAVRTQPSAFPLWRYLVGALAAIALFMAVSYFWTARPALGRGMELSVTGQAVPGGGTPMAGNPVLSISWNHALPEVQKAASAKLIINDGSAHREVTLSPEELTSGSVAYRRLSGQVQVTLILQMPGAVSVIQSSNWQG